MGAHCSGATVSSPFDILKQPRAKTAKPKRKPRYRRLPLTELANTAPHFNVPIENRKQGDRTLAIGGKSL